MFLYSILFSLFITVKSFGGLKRTNFGFTVYIVFFVENEVKSVHRITPSNKNYSSKIHNYLFFFKSMPFLEEIEEFWKIVQLTKILYIQYQFNYHLLIKLITNLNFGGKKLQTTNKPNKYETFCWAFLNEVRQSSKKFY